MAGIYTIGTKLGYDLANGMKPGQSVRATDGSIWTKNQDGTISVQHGNEQLTGQITYQPTPSRQDTIAGMGGGPAYESPYASQLQQVIAGIGSSKWEGWDKDKDESYQALRKQHLREADRTQEDVLGAYAQNTGGIAGSSAITAASQAADYEKSKLNDAVPRLYENAYGRYLNDVAQQRDMAGLLMNAEQMAQSEYYNRINYAMQKWNQLGYADQEVSGILGVAPGTATSDQGYTDWKTAFEQKQYEDKLALAAQKTAGKGGVGGEDLSKKKNPKKDETDDTIDGMSWDDLDKWVRDRLNAHAGYGDPHHQIDVVGSGMTADQRAAAHKIMDAYLQEGWNRK